MKIMVNILCETESKILGQNTGISMELAESTTVKQVVDKLELDTDSIIMLVNGEEVVGDHILFNCDVLCIAPK
jgi:sulfur carrier protein ThiS